MLVSRADRCQIDDMRFLAGLRLVLVAAALIGLLAGRSVVAPVAATAHAMTTTTVKTSHDCCGRTSTAPIDKAGLVGNCLGPACSMIAPAVLPAAIVALFAARRPAGVPVVAASLEGRSPPPLLEPPRA